jgi:hypothetical protein
MKMTIWDILAIVLIAAALIIGAIFLVIFVNPDSSVNPFPPPTLPPTVVIPTSTATLVSLPPTWTPVPVILATKAPTSTPYPTETTFVLP